MTTHADPCVSLVMTIHGERHVGFSILSWDEIGKNPKSASDHVKNVILQKHAFGTFFKLSKSSRRDFFSV